MSGKTVQRATQLLLFACLRFDEVAHHLLLGAHMLDQPLDAFGKAGHRSAGTRGSTLILHEAGYPVCQNL